MFFFLQLALEGCVDVRVSLLETVVRCDLHLLRYKFEVLVLFMPSSLLSEILFFFILQHLSD